MILTNFLFCRHEFSILIASGVPKLAYHLVYTYYSAYMFYLIANSIRNAYRPDRAGPKVQHFAPGRPD